LVFTTFPHSVVFDTQLCTYEIYVCMYVHMYVRMHVCKYVCMYACVYICMYVCNTYLCVFKYVCVYVLVYVFMQAIPLCYLLNNLQLLLRTQHKFILIAP
jgi:hypothetical protein